MNAPAATPTPEELAALIAAAIAPRTRRHDGWLPARQRKFLALLSDGNPVGAACKAVEMSPASAYAFRRTAPGAAFAVAWRAANLLAREVLEDRLLEWSLEGCTERVVKVDDKITDRTRVNQRLSLAMLTRLDENAKPYGPDECEAARLVAQEFDHFLDLIESDIPGVCTAFLADRMAIPYEHTIHRGLTRLERADERMGVPVHDRPECLGDAARETLHTSPLCRGGEVKKGDRSHAREPRHTSQLCGDASDAAGVADCDETVQPNRQSFEELCMTHLGYVPTE